MKSKNGKATFKNDVIGAMLKHSRKQLKQRYNKPLAKHGKETLKEQSK